MSTLARHVSVRDELGVIHSFGPGDDVPEWASRKITNPAAWEDQEAPFPAKRSKGDGPKTATVSAVPADDLEDRIVSRVLEGVGELLRELVVVDDSDDEAGAEPADAAAGPPPKAGKGSGEDKWRAYAASQGVDVADIEDRGDIIAALKDAGVPVE